jgi:hypothetical protein
MTLFESLLKQRRPFRTFRKVQNGKRLPLYRSAWCILCTPTIQRGLPGGDDYNLHSLKVSGNLHPSENSTCFWSLFNFSGQGQPSSRTPASPLPSVVDRQTENSKGRVVPLFNFLTGYLIYYRRLGSSAFCTSFDNCAADDNATSLEYIIKRKGQVIVLPDQLSYT